METISIILPIILSGMFGLAFGSYSTMFAYRLPIGEPCFGRYFGPRSRCRNCQTKLRTRDLVPIFNWLLTKGKCQHCGEQIKFVYLFIESSVFILFILSYLKFGFTDEYIIMNILFACLVILCATEHEFKQFPFQILNAILMLGLVYRCMRIDSVIEILDSVLIAGFIIILIYKLVLKISENQTQAIDSMKFMSIAGIWFEYLNFIEFVTFSFAIYYIFNFFKKKVSLGHCLIAIMIGLVFILF